MYFQALRHLWKPYIWELSRSQKSGQCQSGTGEKFVASWKSCTLTGCWYSNKSWNIKSKYTPRFSGRSWHTSLFLLLNKQRLNSRNRCQAASIIIEDLNLQKKFHTVPTAHVSFSLLYYSGIRFGEFLALTPKDFDFEKKTLDITKSLQRIKKQDVVTPPKTPNSIRNIIIPDFVMNEVKDYMSKPYDLKDTDKVFPFTKSYINNAMERACTKRYRPP